MSKIAYSGKLVAQLVSLAREKKIYWIVPLVMFLGLMGFVTGWASWLEQGFLQIMALGARGFGLETLALLGLCLALPVSGLVLEKVLGERRGWIPVAGLELLALAQVAAVLGSLGLFATIG